MKKTALLCALSLYSLCTNAQYLDSFNIHPSGDSYPRSLVTDGDNLYFYGRDAVNGTQVWAKYKDSANPIRVTDIKSPAGITPISLAVLNDVLYFTATDQTTSTELWQHKNGQSSLVFDINPGNQYSSPQYFTLFKNRIFFQASSQHYGVQLWLHDPVSNITKRLTDTPSTTPAALNMAGLNNSIYFQRANNTTGGELYEYNIGTGKTTLVADIEPGVVSSDAEYFVAWNNMLYFLATTTTHGRELYVYDGTNAPARLTDLAPGQADGVYTGILPVVYKNCLYFVGDSMGNSELCKYDPNTKKAHVAYKLNSGPSDIRNMVVYKDNLFFTTKENKEFHLWSYDGINKPQKVFTVNNAGIEYLTPTTQGLFFSGYSTKNGVELYRYIQYKLAVENIAFDGNAVIYPNPARDVAHIQLKLNAAYSLGLTVTDISGKAVFTKNNTLYSAATHTIDIPMHNEPAGTYTYSIKDADGRMMACGKLQKL